MICYPENISEIEIQVITEYWQIAEGTTDNFLYTANQIFSKYKIHKIRQVNQIVKGSLFSLPSTNFRCRECGATIPVSNRTDYKARAKSEIAPSCQDCVEAGVVSRLKTSQALVKAYNQETFSPKKYIDSLTLAEMLALLSLMTDKPTGCNQLAEPFNSFPLVGVESLDHNLFCSLKEKGAIIDARSMPDEVLSANRFIDDAFFKMERGLYSRLTKADFYVRTIWPGIYFCSPIVNEDVIEKNIPDVISTSINKREISNKDIEDITHIIIEIQVQKLHQAIKEIRKEYQIDIENSGFISSILYYFSKNHAPIGTYFSLRHIGRETVVKLRTRKVPRKAERHVFAKLLSDYSRDVEKYNWSLDLTKALPPSCQTAAMESMFARRYCGETNFDRLSTNEIIKRWLDSAGQ